MSQRLYIVRIVREAYVLAHNEDEARDQRQDIERWDLATINAAPWAGERLDGWDDRCLVYGPKVDTTLSTAKAIDAASALQRLADSAQELGLYDTPAEPAEPEGEKT